MNSAEIFLSKQETTKLKKEITTTEAESIIKELSSKFSIDIMDIAKKIVLKHADGFSLNKNHPYVHLYIGNGSENITVELMTSEKETKMKIPKSFFLV